MDKLKQLWQFDSMDSGDLKTISHTVHVIRVSDGEDPDLFVAQPIYEWQQTEAGKWVMENSSPKPSWHRMIKYDTYGYLYQIRAYLTPQQLTYWKLKYE